eukprot:s6945_g1.t1
MSISLTRPGYPCLLGPACPQLERPDLLCCAGLAPDPALLLPELLVPAKTGHITLAQSADAPNTGAAVRSVGRDRPLPTPCRSRFAAACPFLSLADDDSDIEEEAADLSRSEPPGSDAVSLEQGGVSAVTYRTLLCETASDPGCAAFAIAAATVSVLLDAFPSLPQALQHNSSQDALPLRFTLADKLDHCRVIPQASIWPAREVVCAQSPCRPLSVGGVELPFAWRQLLDLFDPGTAIADYAAASRFCPALLRWLPDDILHELALACSGISPGALVCYTDGSFTARPQESALCGWACVYFDPGPRALGFLYQAFPSFLVEDAFCTSPFQGEVAGLLAAALSATAAFGHRDLLFLSDCTSAVGIAAGTHIYDRGTFSQVMRHAHCFRRTVRGRCDAYDHVRGHQGHVGNELADALAKAAAQHAAASCGLLATRTALCNWLCAGAPFLPWAGSAIQQAAGHPALPPAYASDLGDDTYHGGLDASQLLEPFLPLGAFPNKSSSKGRPAPGSRSPNAGDGVFCLTVATFNVLSLGPTAEDENGSLPAAEGLAYRPGRAPLLAAQLAAHDIHAICLQETRAEPGFSKVGGYLRYASGAENGHWGTEWWFLGAHPLFRASGSVDVVSFREQRFAAVHSDPRRLFIRFSHAPIRLLFLGLHAPHRATESGILEQWWLDARRLVLQHWHGEIVLLAGDFNAGLGSVTSMHVGPLGAEEEDTAGAYLHSLLQHLDCCAPATMPDYHCGATHTYSQKRGGRLCRIDYVCVPCRWLCGWCRSFSVPGLHAAHSCPDHVATAIQVEFSFQSTSVQKLPRKRSFRAEDFLAPENASAIEQALAGAPPIPWDVSSHAHAASLISFVQATLSSLQPSRRARPHHAYLQPATWELQQQVAAARRSFHRLQHRVRTQFLAVCFDAWCIRRGPLTLVSSSAWGKQADQAIAAHQAVLRRWCSQLRRMCRDDRAAYLGRLADQVSRGPSQEVFKNLHSLLGHKRKRRYCAEPLPALQLASGALCTDGDQILARWRQHFGSLEAGQALGFQELAQRTFVRIQASGQVARSWPCPESLLDLPSVADVQRLLVSAQAGKAPGPDGVPAEFGRRFAKHLAPHLHQLALKVALRGSEPLGFKSGQAVWFYKGKGMLSSCSSYRAILLLPSWGKVLHQALRSPLKRHFEATSPVLQLGGKAGISVVFGSHLIRGAARIAAASGRTHFTLFTDIASAFYTVIQQLVARRGDEALSSDAVARATSGLRLSPDESAALGQHLLEPTAMSTSGASAWLEALTSRFQEDNFFVLKGDDQAVTTARGSRPGSSWADLVFAEVISRVLLRRNALRQSGHAYSQPVTLPWDGQCSLAGVSDPTEELSLDDVVWADDVAIPRFTHPINAAAALAFETSGLVDAFKEFGFTLAFGPHKTAGVLSLQGPGSRSAQRHVFGTTGLRGSIPVLLEAGAVSLPLVPAYRHLGCQQSPGGRMLAELQYRISQARAAFAEGRRKVYKVATISVRRKAHILNATVIARLVHGAGSWGPLAKGEFKIFSGAVWSFYRPLLGLDWQADQHIDAPSCYALLDLPSPTVLLRVQRLLYLGQLASSAPPVVWAVLKADRASASQFMSDLVWWHSWTWSTTGLPSPSDDWSAWLTLLRTCPRRYKGIVKRARALEGRRNHVEAALQCLNRSLILQYGDRTEARHLEPPPMPEVCIPCKRAFSTRLSWAGHCTRKHGYRSHAFLCAEDKICRACGKRFSSIGRLRRHLVAQPGCVTSWGSFTPGSSSRTVLHSQALPECAEGCFATMPLDGIRTDVAGGLLCELQAVDPADESAAWDLVQGYVEPLAILRATVTAWRDELPACHLRKQTADNILLLLDVDLLADTRQPTAAARNPLLAPGSQWRTPCAASLVCGRP